MVSAVNPSQLLNQVVRYYHETFKKSQTQAAKEYLKTRGITDEGLFEKFQIGYGSGSMFKKIPAEGDYFTTLQELGVLTKGKKGGNEFFYGYVTFPIFDTDGNCVEMYGRLVVARKKDKPEHLYLAGPHKGVWNQEAFTKHREIILTEGIIDALTLYQMNLTNVVSLYGTNGFTKDHERFFKTYQPEKVFLALDRDEAGEKASEKIAEKLTAFSIPCFRVVFPEGKDVNEYIHNLGHTKAEFETLLSEARPMEVKMSGKGTVTEKDGLSEFSFGERTYQVRELKDEDWRMKANVRALHGERFHVDVIDLYVHKTRRTFSNACARLFELDPPVIEKDLATIIDHLEKRKVRRQVREKEDEDKPYEMSSEEEEEAISFLKSPGLLDQMVRHLDICGYVGEELNKKIGYLIALSRKLENPLSGVIISNSGAGKSKLMEHLASLVPPEDAVFYTRITPQALYYKEERSLKNKLLITGEDEGLTGVDYSLRELISSKVLRMATPLKDPLSGKMKTVEYEVEGPISLLFSTTKTDIHYENATRCFILFLDESSAQTSRVHQSQRMSRTLEGFQKVLQADSLRRLHQNAQRLLKPLVIVNPFASGLTFPNQWLQMRRELEKYLSLIESIALLHQYQRETKTFEAQGKKFEYIEVTMEDIELANSLMDEFLRQNMEELKKPSRELLKLIRKFVWEQCEKEEIDPSDFKFNRRDVREYTRWSDNQIKKHIKQLEDLEYLIVAAGHRGKMYRYELAYPMTEKNEKWSGGLTTVETLRMNGNGTSCTSRSIPKYYCNIKK